MNCDLMLHWITMEYAISRKKLAHIPNCTISLLSLRYDTFFSWNSELHLVHGKFKWLGVLGVKGKKKERYWEVPLWMNGSNHSKYLLLQLLCFAPNLQSFNVNNYRLITAYLLLQVNLDKIMHARWDFDASSARTRRVSALDKHQNWRATALFCLNSRAQSK